MKETGILLAVSSLPSRTGVGELGRPAYEWIDLLAENGVSIWQILPLNPTGYGNSPYQPYSSCAGDELYLSLELLAQQGLLPEVPEFAGANPGRVEYEAVRAWKEPLLRAACAACSSVICSCGVVSASPPATTSTYSPRGAFS